MGNIDSIADEYSLQSGAAARGVVVIGIGSARTREVLRALTEVPNVVWPTSRGDALLHCAGEDTACVVIADDLDGESALDLLSYIRDRRPNLPIYLVTDSGDMADAVAGMRNGATAVVEIPPSYDLLRSYVLQTLR
jgi:DNA-binding NtrC family response regulator